MCIEKYLLFKTTILNIPLLADMTKNTHTRTRARTSFVQPEKLLTLLPYKIYYEIVINRSICPITTFNLFERRLLLVL